VCPDPDFPFLLSKRSHGPTDLAPRKVLKTASASAAGAAPGLAGQLSFSQDAPQRGPQAAPVAVERVPEAGSSVEAVVALGEAAGVAMASGPPDMPPALAPAAAEVVVVLAMERPVAADAEMAEVSLLGASEEGGVEPRPVPPSGSLVPTRRSSEGRHQLLRFRTCEASDPFFVLDDEREEQSWVELRECAEATVGLLRSSLEVFCRDVPKILQVMISGIPFFVIKASFVMPRFLPSGSDGPERRQVVVHPPRGRCLGSLRSLRTSLARATARLSQQGAEVADLRLLYADLGAEAAAARVEVQRRQSELDQVTDEWDQSRGRAAEAESRARALAADLAIAQAASSEQRARAGGMSWLF
jgi:hypothetical protein